jgi:hypothetical protein
MSSSGARIAYWWGGGSDCPAAAAAASILCGVEYGDLAIYGPHMMCYRYVECVLYRGLDH